MVFNCKSITHDLGRDCIRRIIEKGTYTFPGTGEVVPYEQVTCFEFDQLELAQEFMMRRMAQLNKRVITCQKIS